VPQGVVFTPGSGTDLESCDGEGRSFPSLQDRGPDATESSTTLNKASRASASTWAQNLSRTNAGAGVPNNSRSSLIPQKKASSIRPPSESAKLEKGIHQSFEPTATVGPAKPCYRSQACFRSFGHEPTRRPRKHRPQGKTPIRCAPCECSSRACYNKQNANLSPRTFLRLYKCGYSGPNPKQRRSI
jgi:hypothetical protein